MRGDVADPFAEGANASSVALNLHLHTQRGGGDTSGMCGVCAARVRVRVRARVRALVRALDVHRRVCGRLSCAGA